MHQCFEQKRAWSALKVDLLSTPLLFDPAWQREVLTQPVAIKTVAAFAKTKGAVKFFDAGDVQAHGFQIVEDDTPFETFTESGASYMGFAVSATLASALADAPAYPIAFTGDGSFMMNPQVLIDAVQHKLRGMILIFDNRRMAAISDLQRAQYAADFADFVVWDSSSNKPVAVARDQLGEHFAKTGIKPALAGSFKVTTTDGKSIDARPVFDLTREYLDANMTPAQARQITWAPEAAVVELAPGHLLALCRRGGGYGRDAHPRHAESQGRHHRRVRAGREHA